jgi:acetate kinase
LRDTQEFSLAAVGHRVVHGGPKYDLPILVDDRVLADLERYVPLAPLHQPNNLAPIRSLLSRYPHLPQVACFDTAFHRGHSEISDRYAIPKPLYEEGVRRYGFHGLSYEYVAERFKQLAPDLAAALKAPWGSPHSMACRWDRARDKSIPASFFTWLAKKA